MATDRSVLLDAGGRPLRRPVVYLDHSTLVDAFDGKRNAPGPNAATNAKLAGIVEEAARQGTLCISIIHVFELARHNQAVAMAMWLGGLAPLWFQMDEADREELANEVKRRLGLQCVPRDACRSTTPCPRPIDRVYSRIRLSRARRCGSSTAPTSPA